MTLTFKQFIAELSADEVSTKLEYHDTLNPKIWLKSWPRSNPKDISWALLPEVKTALTKIANEFIKYLGISSNDVKDIVFVGSNASYNWSSLSDIDLHIMADLTNNSTCKSCTSTFVNDCFNDKKTLWNAAHDISIHGFNVELYVQDSNSSNASAGIYSIKTDEWLTKPEFKPFSASDIEVKVKASEIMTNINTLIDSKSDDKDMLVDIKNKIREMRSAGLAKGGEGSVENLVFKTLRNNGYIDKLSTYITHLEDRDLSI